MTTVAPSELRLAKRMARLGTETAFEVLVKARALEARGRDIVHLEIGEPDFDTPANVIEAACDALHKGFTHYGPSAGMPPLRETIAQYVSETRGVNVTPDEVVVVPGGKPIIFFSILALVEEGDEVEVFGAGLTVQEVAKWAGTIPYEDRVVAPRGERARELVGERDRAHRRTVSRHHVGDRVPGTAGHDHAHPDLVTGRARHLDAVQRARVVGTNRAGRAVRGVGQRGRRPQRHDVGRRGHRQDQRVAGGRGCRRGDDQLQAARLAVQPPALLG